MLTKFVATATTVSVSPGSEQIDDRGMLRIWKRVFSDVVESADDRIAGRNAPSLDIDVDTTTGDAILSGRFTLAPENKGGSWEGEMQGQIVRGYVTASGLAHGRGALEGAILRVDFKQVDQLTTPAACIDPKAFFEMEGWILQR